MTCRKLEHHFKNLGELFAHVFETAADAAEAFEEPLEDLELRAKV